LAAPRTSVGMTRDDLSGRLPPKRNPVASCWTPESRESTSKSTRQVADTKRLFLLNGVDCTRGGLPKNRPCRWRYSALRPPAYAGVQEGTVKSSSWPKAERGFPPRSVGICTGKTISGAGSEKFVRNFGRRLLSRTHRYGPLISRSWILAGPPPGFWKPPRAPTRIALVARAHDSESTGFVASRSRTVSPSGVSQKNVSQLRQQVTPPERQRRTP
jgi:hypothetical protein